MPRASSARPVAWARNRWEFQAGITAAHQRADAELAFAS